MLTVSFDLRGAGESRGCCCLWPIPLLSGCPEVSDGAKMRAKSNSLNGCFLIFFLFSSALRTHALSLIPTSSNATFAVVTICNWVTETLGRDTYILGVSAGGPIGIGALDTLPSIRGYTSVACTLGVATNILFGPRVLSGLLSRKPKLFIMGTNDIFTSVASYKLCMRLARHPRTAVLVPGAGHFDLEYRPLARLDARLVAEFISAGGTLPARLEGGAVHLAAYSHWCWVSLCNCGPLYMILFVVGTWFLTHCGIRGQYC